jgi:hydrogenase nickel insertion protein HypA
MHDFTATAQLVESILGTMRQQNAEGVTEVRLVVGELTFLTPEQVRFAFRELARHTPLEGCRLLVRSSPGEVHCSACGYEGPIQVVQSPAYHVLAPSLPCPRCGAPTTITAGRECRVERVTLRPRSLPKRRNESSVK